MSNVVPFDTLAMALALRDEAGFDQKQAEGTARVLSRLLVDDLVNKADLEPLADKSDLNEAKLSIKSDLDEARLLMKADLTETRLLLKADLADVKQSFRADLAEAKTEILKWVIGTIGFQTIVILGGVLALAKLSD